MNRAFGGRQRPIEHGFAHRVVRPTQPECRAYQHRSKTRHQKRSAETGGRNGVSIAEFRTRRPAHISETSRYHAVFERPSYVTRWRRTGWLGRRDSNLCISKSDLLKFIPPQRDLGVDRRAFNFEMRKFESCPRAERSWKIPILICRGSNPAAPTGQSDSNAYKSGCARNANLAQWIRPSDLGDRPKSQAARPVIRPPIRRAYPAEVCPPARRTFSSGQPDHRPAAE